MVTLPCLNSEPVIQNNNLTKSGRFLEDQNNHLTVFYIQITKTNT